MRQRRNLRHDHPLPRGLLRVLLLDVVLLHFRAHFVRATLLDRDNLLCGVRFVGLVRETPALPTLDDLFIEIVDNVIIVALKRTISNARFDFYN